jgi:DNA-binding MarR family transcriptional regulator
MNELSASYRTNLDATAEIDPSDEIGEVGVVDPIEAIAAEGVRLAKLLKPDLPGWPGPDLTVGQLRLLARLSEHGPTSMSQIGEWLHIGLPAVTGSVERLERHGLVERRHRADDRRVVEVHLTERARELLDHLTGIRQERMRQALRVLTTEELLDLGRILHAIVERTADRAAGRTTDTDTDTERTGAPDR